VDSTHATLPATPSPHERTHAGAQPGDAVRTTEIAISYVLRGGVLLSATIVLVGVVAFYVRFGSAASRLQVDRVFPHSVAGALSGAAHGNPLAIVALGLLILLVTPVLRVAVSIVAFALEHDWRYVGITALVLAILLVSFALGKAGA
jgi:uncharacterized membrane protein